MNDLHPLTERIASRRAVVGVVGLGHVGLAVASCFADAGLRVVGVDLDVARVARITDGAYPLGGVEPDLPALLARVVASKQLSVSTTYAPLAEADVVIVAVDTPIDEDHRARFESLRAACAAIGRVMRRGALVVIESTVAPGTCDDVVAPILAHESKRALGDGFFLGHCPERVMPGRLLRNLRGLPRVCGGASAETSAAMIALYATIVCAPLTATDCVTAELVKTAENAYRDVNIAFANELALVCEAAGADFGRVRELVNESPGRNVLAAGAGVGGHCIPKDPWLLVQAMTGVVEPRLVTAARAVNDAMPLHVAALVEDALAKAGVPIHGARIAALGYAYLEDSGDTRNSPTAALALRLRERGADVILHDPWVAEHAGDVYEAARGADAVVLMVAHTAYRALDLRRLAANMTTRILVDGRAVVARSAAEAAGFVVRAVGRGSTRRPRVC